MSGRVTGPVLGIIPARLSSTRLPNKPLYPILGRPLIEWVWRRVEKMSVLDHVVVATDSEEVAKVCRALGAPVEMTSGEHPSGTDRVAEVADRPEFEEFRWIANVQGDEPLLKESHLRAAIDMVRERGWDVGTCATPLLTDDARKDASVVKVARASNGRALYFSRARIPYKRDDKPTDEELAREPFLRHVGIYAYTRDALRDWVALAPSPLERLEQLEQLRPLEAGVRIGVAIVGAADHGVDTAADVLRMEERLGSRRATTPGMLCTSMATRVASATAPDPRRRDEGIAVATSRSVNDGDGAVPPQPTNMVQICSSVGAQGDRGPGGRRSSSPYGPVRLVVAPTPELASPLRAGHHTRAEHP